MNQKSEKSKTTLKPSKIKRKQEKWKELEGKHLISLCVLCYIIPVVVIVHIITSFLIGIIIIIPFDMVFG
jgi:flagellar biosynthesis protein FliP